MPAAATSEHASTPMSRVPAELAGRRIASIDAFRGLTILLMIFVNHLGLPELREIPAWLRHAPQDVSGMTIVDVVFPAFLFIVGMSIPLALGRRRDAGEPRWRTASHVLVRAAGLLAIGVGMVNVHRLDAGRTGMSRHLRELLLFVAVILVWNQYPRAGLGRHLGGVLRLVGLAALVWLAAIFRADADGTTTWLRTQWWGILGLIGWAYLVVSLIWLLGRGRPAVLVAALGLCVLLYIVDAAGALAFLGPVRNYIWIGGHVGGHALIVLAGVLVTQIVLAAWPAGSVGPLCPTAKARRRAPGSVEVQVLGCGAALAAAGWLVQPLYGINKVKATPAWGLYSAALCCGAYALLYWLIEVHAGDPDDRDRRRDGAAWRLVRPAGANPLLAYILPDIVYAALGLAGVTWLSTHWTTGWAAVARAGLFAAVMVALTGVLSWLGVRLRL